MSDELLIKCGSPTLAGLKTGNMFSYPYESREEVTSALRRLNKILVPKGLRILPLRYTDKTVLLYLYRIDALRKDLSRQEEKALTGKVQKIVYDGLEELRERMGTPVETPAPEENTKDPA